MLSTVVMFGIKLVAGLLVAGFVLAITIPLATGRLMEGAAWAVAGACVGLVFLATRVWRRR